jgi:hypothetical protein
MVMSYQRCNSDVKNKSKEDGKKTKMKVVKKGKGHGKNKNMKRKEIPFIEESSIIKKRKNVVEDKSDDIDVEFKDDNDNEEDENTIMIPILTEDDRYWQDLEQQKSAWSFPDDTTFIYFGESLSFHEKKLPPPPPYIVATVFPSEKKYKFILKKKLGSGSNGIVYLYMEDRTQYESSPSPNPSSFSSIPSLSSSYVPPLSSLSYLSSTSLSSNITPPTKIISPLTSLYTSTGEDERKTIVLKISSGDADALISELIQKKDEKSCPYMLKCSAHIKPEHESFNNNEPNQPVLSVMKQYGGSLFDLLDNEKGNEVEEKKKQKTLQRKAVADQSKSIIHIILNSIVCHLRKYNLLYTDIKTENIFYEVTSVHRKDKQIGIHLLLGDIGSFCKDDHRDCIVSYLPPERYIFDRITKVWNRTAFVETKNGRDISWGLGCLYVDIMDYYLNDYVRNILYSEDFLFPNGASINLMQFNQWRDGELAQEFYNNFHSLLPELLKNIPALEKDVHFIDTMQQCLQWKRSERWNIFALHSLNVADSDKTLDDINDVARENKYNEMKAELLQLVAIKENMNKRVKDFREFKILHGEKEKISQVELDNFKLLIDTYKANHDRLSSQIMNKRNGQLFQSMFGSTMINSNNIEYFIALLE